MIDRAVWLFSYHYHALAALLERARRSIDRRGLVETLRMGWRRYKPRSRSLPRPRLYADTDLPPGHDFGCRQPRASIVVPAYNHVDMTLRCLAALAHSGDATAHEVIVVDDASTDGTSERLGAVAGLVLLRNAQNLGFIDTCNAGAAAARGEFLVFLNNDTVVQPGWLDALLGTFESHSDTGAAGSQLIFPNGSLQEAGGVVFADGSAANYGRGEDRGHPNFSFVREADYCSGAALAVPAALFAELGGFDRHYQPAYFEDTDLAMRVRARGLKVRYQPASVVVHFEGGTAGTDVRTGMKAHQLVNQERFRERWADVLREQHPAPPADLRDPQPMALAANHRAVASVLVLDATTPTPDRDSGSVRMREILRLLCEEGCAVGFVDELHEHRGRYTQDLLQLGVEAWWRPWIGGLPAWLRQHGRRFDAIIVSRHYVLTPVLPLLRRLAPQARIVFDSVDLHFLREQREAENAGSPSALRRAARTREAELALVRAVDRTWVVSEAERQLLAREAPGCAVELVSNVHVARRDTPGVGARDGMVFVGSYSHSPNLDAARWLLAEILPRVRRELPALQLHLVGADPPAEILALGEAAGANVAGHVADLDALLDRCRVSVAPLRYGAGVKGKVNQAMARGLPVVATPIAAEGMHLLDGHDVLLAEDAESFAAAIVRLCRDDALWQRLREGGWENTRRYFSREAARAVLRPFVASLRQP